VLPTKRFTDKFPPGTMIQALDTVPMFPYFGTKEEIERMTKGPKCPCPICELEAKKK
jgi:hypothetical protein